MPGGRPCTSSACARRTPTPRPWPGCASQVQAADDEDFQARFGPAVDGLAYVIAGGRFDVTGIAPDPGGGRRFLGWTAGPHWILTADASSNAPGRPAST